MTHPSTNILVPIMSKLGGYNKEAKQKCKNDRNQGNKDHSKRMTVRGVVPLKPICMSSCYFISGASNGGRSTS